MPKAASSPLKSSISLSNIIECLNEDEKIASYQPQEINTLNIIGDSLSDSGRKYHEECCFIIPFRVFLHKSPKGEFTDEDTWPVYLQADLQKKGYDIKIKNQAEGGATLDRYRFSYIRRYWRIYSFLCLIKDLFMSLFFLGSLRDQADFFKKHNQLHSKNLVVIWGGANDLITLKHMDEVCVERLVTSAQKIIDQMSQPDGRSLWNEQDNHAHELLVFELPDISQTPRFDHKSKEEKEEIRRLCESYNNKINALAKQYRYVDFKKSEIYTVKWLADLNIPKIGKGIVFVGRGAKREVYFIENGKLIFCHNKDKKSYKLPVSLTKKQQKILSIKEQEPGNLAPNSALEAASKKDVSPLSILPCHQVMMGKLVGNIIAEAKLNANLKVLPLAQEFKDIIHNPEDYGLTVGCAIFLASKSITQEDVAQLATNESAIILIPNKPASNEYQVQIVENGRLLNKNLLDYKLGRHQQAWVKKRLKLNSFLAFLWFKIKSRYVGSPVKLTPLLADNGLHNRIRTSIIVDVVKKYEQHYKEDISVTDIYKSVLDFEKQGLPTKHLFFWDDVHPAESVHKIIKDFVLKTLRENWSLQKKLSRLFLVGVSKEEKGQIRQDECILSKNVGLLFCGQAIPLETEAKIVLSQAQATEVIQEISSSQESLVEENQGQALSSSDSSLASNSAIFFSMRINSQTSFKKEKSEEVKNPSWLHDHRSVWDPTCKVSVSS